MFLEEFAATNKRKFVWAYFIVPTLLAMLLVLQLRPVISAGTHNEGQLESLMLMVLAEVAGAVGLFGLVLGAIHGSKRFPSEKVPPKRFFVMVGAVLTRAAFYVAGIPLLTWAILAGLYRAQGVVVPEWSLMLSAVLRMILFAVVLILVGCASGVAFSSPLWSILTPLAVFVVGTQVITWLATSVTPWAVLFGPIDNFLVWCSGYRIRLIPMWQASVYWFLVFGIIISAFLLRNKARKS